VILPPTFPGLVPGGKTKKAKRKREGRKGHSIAVLSSLFQEWPALRGKKRRRLWRKRKKNN